MAIDQQIWYWPYELQSANALNSVSQRKTFSGLLIRVGNGYGCIHPWPELGDATIDKQLNSLKTGHHTNLVKQALHCAELDGKARTLGLPLYSPAEPLQKNHWLWQAGDSIDQLKTNRFRKVKLKVGPTNLPTDLLAQLQQAELTVRLDANDSLNYDTILNWWQSLPIDTQKTIEFIEDPIPWDPKQWAQLRAAGIPIAADRDVNQRIAESNWAIIKPATDTTATFETDNVVFTSYMDHPLGQLWAASQAQEYYKTHTAQTCGLLTHRCFAENDFSARLSVENAELLPTEGTGLGFDDLLETLPWRSLK